MQITVDDIYNIDLSEHAGDLDIIQTPDGSYHLIHDHQSYRVELLSHDMNAKTMTLSINGHEVALQIKDKSDELIEQLGFELAATQKVKDIKAPMPGLVLDILTEVGATVEEGTPLLILEAMKMENVIKSPGEGVVKSINVNIKDAIDKGSIMIEME